MEVAEEEEEEEAAEDDFVGVSAPFTRIICGDCGGDRGSGSGRCLVDDCGEVCGEVCGEDCGEDCDCLDTELRRGRGGVCSRVVRGECRGGEVRGGGVRAPSPSPATSCSATSTFSAEARRMAGLLMIRVSWWRGETIFASSACVLLMRKGRRKIDADRRRTGETKMGKWGR